MLEYCYHPETKLFIEAVEACLDPLESELQGKEIFLLSANSTFIKPPEYQVGFVCRWTDKAWEQIEDLRGTKYWLSTDAWNSPAREMKELGSLPDDAMFAPPLPPLSVIKDSKLREIAQAYESVLAYMISPETYSPISAALAVTDFAADDPEGLTFIREQLSARRDELEGLVNSAETRNAVDAVNVSWNV